MADVPVVPVAPVAPITQGITSDTSSKQVVPAVDPKVVAPKGTTAAEKAVIQKIKIGDTEYDETTLKSMIEKSKGADKKFLEAAQARKEAMRFFKMAKENPREFLEKTGIDPKKFSYDEVARDIQDKLRDPKDVELDKVRAENKAFKEQEAAAKEQIKQDKLSKQAKAMEERFHAEAIRALEAHPAIPKTAFSVARMAKYIEVVQQKTGELLSFEDVAGTIENDIRAEVSGIVKGATAEQLIALIGEEGAEVIRQYHLAKLKDPLAGNSGASGQATPKTPYKKQNSRDVWKEIDEKAALEGYNRFGQKVR